MRDEFEEPQPPALKGDAEAGVVEGLGAGAASLLPVPSGIQLLNRDFLTDSANLPDGSIDLIVADPPYGLGKDYGNDSDMRSGEDFLAWTREWLDHDIPKLKPSG
jgi:site-specific DNA-methyltransferase (adenine-specific)